MGWPIASQSRKNARRTAKCGALAHVFGVGQVRRKPSYEVAKCEEYALKIGLAFQVADDILDVEASTEDLGKTAGKDEEVDKTTYPKLLGLERSKEVAQELVDEAKAALSQFGDAAAPLNGLADYIIQRKN